jgi:signal transduction histidine kinase
VDQGNSDRKGFEAKVAGRFGILPNFFRSTRAAPELIDRLWSFAEAAYLDNPMPSLLKERLFVFLSRFCTARYCIVRHIGFLLGHGHGFPAGDCSSALNTVDEVVRLLSRPTPWNRDMESVYHRLGDRTEPLSGWPKPDTELEDMIFACATMLFNEPGRSESARVALLTGIGDRNFEFLAGFLAFVRTAHYWTMLHPEIETEEDMVTLLRQYRELSTLVLNDREADRCEMGHRLFEELTALRELHERNELEKAKRALEAKDRQKDEFIAVLGHELRNPLAAIRAATDALAVIGTSDSRAEQYRALVDRQSMAMIRMLEDLLDASRVALGKVAVSIEDLDFGAIIRSVIAEHEARARTAGLTITVQLPETPCYVRADQVRLRQVIDNLLSNALKFTPSAGQITLQLLAHENKAVLRVTDSGVGFDAEVGERLFDPFFQAGKDLARSGGGLGLGLALGARLAEHQGGRLRATSDGPGKGATFSLTMPRATQGCDSTVRSETRQLSGSGRVLLVEDNAEVRKSLADLLEVLGFEVHIATDGHEALARARVARPDVILCDLGLPNGMDGYAVARAFKSDPMLRPIRLIALSGYSRRADCDSATAAGFEKLIPKPVTLKSLESLAFTK